MRLTGIILAVLTLLVVPSLRLAADGACLPTMSITAVKYLGKSSGDDQFQVDFSITSSGKTCAAVDGNGLTLTLGITRIGGHTDSKTNAGFGPLSFRQLVAMPRGALERDPVSYTATLEAKLKSNVNAQTTRVSTAAVVAPTNDQLLACCPKVPNVTVQNIVPSVPPTRDTVKVTWTFTPSSCLKLTGTNVTLKTTHANQSTCSGSQFVTDVNAREVTLHASCPAEPTSVPGAITKIEAVVIPILSPVLPLKTTKTGTF